MDPLRTLARQLSLAVAAAKEASSSATLSFASQDDVNQLQTLASEIERLQTELQLATTVAVTQARQQAAKPHEDVAAAVDSDTETEDEELALGQPIAGQKRAQEAAESATQQPERKRPWVDKQKLPLKIQQFADATDTAAALVATDQEKMQDQVATRPFGFCRSVANIFIAMLEEGDDVDDVSATLYRDTTTKLVGIMLDERTHGRVPVKSLSTMFDRLGTLVELARAGSTTPAALLDPVLEETQLKVKQFVEEHDGDSVKRMQTLVHTSENQKRGLVGKTLEVALNRVLVIMLHDARHAMATKELGLAPRSEEHWTIFTEITSVVGEWIGRTAIDSKESSQMRSTTRALKKLNKEFPGRVAPVLLKNAGLRQRLWRQQMKANKKKAKAS